MGLFGADKIKLNLEKHNFKPGETITGNISLNLKKPVKARDITVSLIGRIKERYRNSQGHTSYRTVDVYNFDIPIRGEGDYQKETFNFEIKIPDDIKKQMKINTPDLDGALGKLVAISRALSKTRSYPVQWMVKAQLDIPLKFDVKKSQKIVISET